MKTSKVKSVTVGSQWTSKHGDVMFNHEYTFEDGASLQASHKSENPFKVGDDVEYEITQTDEKFGDKGKVKKPDTGFKGGGGYKPDTVGITVGACINKAVDMYIAGKLDDVKKIEPFAKWLAEMSFKLKEELKDKA
jgi:hypothetical protein